MNGWDTDYRDRAERPDLYPTWRAALPALLVAVVDLALWTGGGWLVARLVEAVAR
jgi:hypothetical protein